jgi:hypothetical protein
MQHAHMLPVRKRRISRTGIFHGLFPCQLDNRIQTRINGLDPLEMRPDNLF